MHDEPRLSVVIPVRDERPSLAALHRELDAALASLRGGVEFVFVDDGSRDGSGDALRALAAADPRVRVLALPRPSGQSAALWAGFRAARGAVTATLDADLQNDPADLPRLLERLRDADWVDGVRTPRADGWWRRLTSRVANGVRNLATGERVTDVGCSLRVMRTELLRDLPPFDGMHRFLPVLARRAGARVAEVPVSHRPRRHGRSKYGTGDRLRAGAVDLLGVLWLRRRLLRAPAEEWRGGCARRGAQAGGSARRVVSRGAKS